MSFKEDTELALELGEKFWGELGLTPNAPIFAPMVLAVTHENPNDEMGAKILSCYSTYAMSGGQLIPQTASEVLDTPEWKAAKAFADACILIAKCSPSAYFNIFNFQDGPEQDDE